VKVVLLAGGRGTRLAEESAIRPKPMVEIGGQPILWHIMQHYAAYGFCDFLVASGYKGEMIRDYFQRLGMAVGGAGADSANSAAETQWTVQVVGTGADTMTGGRILRLKDRLGDGGFMVTYGDGLADVDLRALLAFHRAHGRIATVTAVHPPARFGALELAGERVTAFSEKPQAGEGWINGGFFVFEPRALDYLQDDATILERAPLERLAADGQLMAYRHQGFWQPMDTLREKDILEALWAGGEAPWKTRT
jgi:glucose-1-phosphate cytidylyltransferase